MVVFTPAFFSTAEPNPGSFNPLVHIGVVIPEPLVSGFLHQSQEAQSVRIICDTLHMWACVADGTPSCSRSF